MTDNTRADPKIRFPKSYGRTGRFYAKSGNTTARGNFPARQHPRSLFPRSAPSLSLDTASVRDTEVCLLSIPPSTRHVPLFSFCTRKGFRPWMIFITSRREFTATSVCQVRSTRPKTAHGVYGDGRTGEVHDEERTERPSVSDAVVEMVERSITEGSPSANWLIGFPDFCRYINDIFRRCFVIFSSFFVNKSWAKTVMSS